MFRRFVKFLNHYARGEEADFEAEFELSWMDIGAILIIIILLVRWIWIK